ncbi:MAG TPA: outer membrane lipid asymmetry maintenance protein MlaD [Nevskiaceae bacterium]|nr:outer membrane lipid asymmetry maintenance protein MlaD [Nevskiaceae bacterium]
MKSRSMEMLVGLFFCLGVGAIFILTFRVASLASVGPGKAYHLTATFENIGGLKRGAAVTMAGVRIGRVRNITIDRSNFEAKVTLEMNNQYDNIPADSNAKILTAGLLGEQYIGLEPGGDEASLKDGDTIKFTQSAFVLENIIGQVLVSMTNKGGKKDDTAAPPPAETPAPAPQK